MPAALVVNVSAKLSPVQKDALEIAAATLPDHWSVMVGTEDLLHASNRFSVRILGDGYATVSGFAPATHPDQLAAFVQRAGRARRR